MIKHILKVTIIIAMTLGLPNLTKAALDLDTPVPGVNGGIYASEINITSNIDLLDGAAADHQATVTFGASFASNAPAYVRIDISGGTWRSRVDPADFTVNDSFPIAAYISVSQGGAIGDDYVIFVVTPNNGESLVGTNVATFDLGLGAGKGVNVINKNGVDIQYRLYETLTNASNEILHLKDSGLTEWLTFANAITIVPGAAQDAVADAAVTPAFSTFTGSDNSNPVALFSISHTFRALTSGAASVPSIVLANTNDIILTGDFSWASDVELNAAASCPGGGIDASSFNGSGATFSNVSASNMIQNPWYVCVNANGTDAITVSNYTGNIDLDGQSGYTPPDGNTGTGAVSRSQDLAECNSNILVTKPASNYVDHGDGTVTDKKTGLVWQKCTLGLTGTDCSGGAASTFTWQGALDAANTNSDHGYSDWRLPNKNELASLVEDACNAPAINSTVFPATSGNYWSSSPYANDDKSAWGVHFNNGLVSGEHKNNTYPVRLVRGSN